MASTVETKTKIKFLEEAFVPILRINTAQLSKPSQRDIALKKLKFALSSLKEAGEFLKAGDLSKFDAVGGDCACQIRAVQVLDAKSQISSEQIDVIVEQARKSISCLEALPEAGLDIRMMELVFKACEIEVDEEIFDLSLARALTVVKETVVDERSGVIRDIAIHTKLGFEGSGAVLPSMQAALTERSVAYLQIKTTRSYKGSDIDTLTELFASSVKICGRSKKQAGLKVYPFYHGLKLLIGRIKEKGFPVTFVADSPEYKALPKKVFIYKDGRFNSVSAKEFSKEKACFVIAGKVSASFSKALSSVTSDSLEDIILSNGAYHNQYVAGGEGGDFIPSVVAQEELKRVVQSFENPGENPDAFFIQHVFADTLTFEEVI